MTFGSSPCPKQSRVQKVFQTHPYFQQLFVVFEAEDCVWQCGPCNPSDCSFVSLFKKDYAEVFIHIGIILKRRSNSTNRIYVMRHYMDFDQVKFEYLPWKQCSFEWTQCFAQGIIWNWKDKFAWFLFRHFNSLWSSYGKHHLVQKNWISTYSCIRRANFLNVYLVYSLVWHDVSYH